jgi:adenine-specific DNA-methyltransferase
MNLNVEKLGQVFTPDYIVSSMLKLRKNYGTVLEPSCGNGAFFSKIPCCIGVEYDKTVAPDKSLIMDFFDYPLENKFDTIIGNPPYVAYKMISQDTKGKLDMTLFDKRSNLYLFFIHKCIQHLNPHGELIFIVPRDFLKASSSIKLNQYIYDMGTITDIIDLGDKKIFKDACPNCVIFRFEKDNFDRITNENKIFSLVNGQIFFMSKNYSIKFSDLFFVKVGAVSGADKYFSNENGNKEFVCSITCNTGKTRRMFYNQDSEELKKYKDILITRKIKHFTENDWYMWGRKYYESDENRIYVNNKTRNLKPFFFHPCKAYDGTVLAIFPKFKTTADQCKKLTEELNNVDWYELGFVCDGRFLFNQKALENCLLPDVFSKYIT